MTTGRQSAGPRALGLAAALVALAAAAGCVKKPEATSCGTGIYCPAGMKCAARQAVCIVDDCGDGVVQPGEACDDGNLVDGDGCSHDCTSAEICGNWTKDVAVGEECDDGNLFDGDGCSSVCKSEVCGNGLVEGSEQCDGRGETSYCNADCTVSVCGDGKLNGTAHEECDDGNASNGDDCVERCRFATCGDGFVDSVPTSAHYEECDLGSQGNSDNPTCTYGERACAGCSTACRTLVPVTRYCGNGVRDVRDWGGVEPCDSPASYACKTCRIVNSSTCETVPVAAATGSVTVASPAYIADGDSITLDDGRGRTLTIEFDVDGLCTTDHGGAAWVSCLDPRGATAFSVADGIAAAVGSAPLEIAARSFGSTVMLLNLAHGVSGTVEIARSGAIVVNGAVTATGMSGGAGCSSGRPCDVDTDCVSDHCDAGACR